MRFIFIAIGILFSSLSLGLLHATPTTSPGTVTGIFEQTFDANTIIGKDKLVFNLPQGPQWEHTVTTTSQAASSLGTNYALRFKADDGFEVNGKSFVARETPSVQTLRWRNPLGINQQANVLEYDVFFNVAGSIDFSVNITSEYRAYWNTAGASFDDALQIGGDFAVGGTLSTVNCCEPDVEGGAPAAHFYRLNLSEGEVADFNLQATALSTLGTNITVQLFNANRESILGGVNLLTHTTSFDAENVPARSFSITGTNDPTTNPTYMRVVNSPFTGSYVLDYNLPGAFIDVPQPAPPEGFTSFTNTASVPEPATWWLLCLGTLLVACKRRSNQS